MKGFEQHGDLCQGLRKVPPSYDSLVNTERVRPLHVGAKQNDRFSRISLCTIVSHSESGMKIAFYGSEEQHVSRKLSTAI